MITFVYVDPPKSTKIEAESLKEGIISAVKLTKVFGDSFNMHLGFSFILCVYFLQKGLSKGSGLLQKKVWRVYNSSHLRCKLIYVLFRVNKFSIEYKTG